MYQGQGHRPGDKLALGWVAPVAPIPSVETLLFHFFGELILLHSLSHSPIALNCHDTCYIGRAQ